MALYRGGFPWTREAKKGPWAGAKKCSEVRRWCWFRAEKKAMKKGWDGKGWPLSFLRCERIGFIPVPQTTSARLKCLAVWHVAEEMVLHPSSCVSLRDIKKRKELCVTRFQSYLALAKYWFTLRTECQGKCLPLFTLQLCLETVRTQCIHTRIYILAVNYNSASFVLEVELALNYFNLHKTVSVFFIQTERLGIISVIPCVCVCASHTHTNN